MRALNASKKRERRRAKGRARRAVLRFKRSLLRWEQTRRGPRPVLIRCNIEPDYADGPPWGECWPPQH